MYDVNKEKWQALMHGKVASVIAGDVWPGLGEAGQKISKIANGKQLLARSDLGKLANALGCNIDNLIEVFPYLKDGK